MPICNPVSEYKPRRAASNRTPSRTEEQIQEWGSRKRGAAHREGRSHRKGQPLRGVASRGVATLPHRGGQPRIVSLRKLSSIMSKGRKGNRKRGGFAFFCSLNYPWNYLSERGIFTIFQAPARALEHAFFCLGFSFISAWQSLWNEYLFHQCSV